MHVMDFALTVFDELFPSENSAGLSLACPHFPEELQNFQFDRFSHQTVLSFFGLKILETYA